MEDLLHEFVNKCDELMAIGSGYSSLIGGTPLEKAINEQDKIISIFRSVPKNQFTFIEGILDSRRVFLENRNIFFETLHSFYVQTWLSFLDNVFGNILERHFAGEMIYKIKPVTIKFVSYEDTPEKLAENIKGRVKEYFSNQVAPMEKLNILEKTLNREITSKLKNNIKKHIVVRNLIQHNRGKLRERDLQTLDCSSFLYPNANGEEQGNYYNPEQIRDYGMKKYSVGSVVEVDTVVLGQIHLDLIHAAKCLLA